MTIARGIATGLTVAAALFAAIQFVPYGHRHTNPPAGKAVAWDSPRTLELARRTCFNCHSNETSWPWYASVAPVSWKIQRHVDEGREKLNFTAFEPGQQRVARAAGKAWRELSEGDMPPGDYLLMHPEARLDAAEKQELVRGLKATFAAFAARAQERGDEHD